MVSRKFEFNLEALRGFAALTVVFHHILFYQFSLDPSYIFKNKWQYALPGHSCVLLFFILSGYVIGLTTDTLFTSKNIYKYIYKRLTRLYPIYFVSVLLAIVILTHHYAPYTIIGQFFFLQNSIVPLIYENNPLWSLNNEVLYYLLFIPLSYQRLPPKVAFIITTLAGILFATIIPQYEASSYCIGFAYWISGLWLAKSDFFTKSYCSKLELAALILLFLGYQSLNPFEIAPLVLLEKMHIHLAQRISHTGLFAGVNFTDIFSLPFLFYIFLRFTDRSFTGNKLFCACICMANFWYYYHIATKYGIASSEGASLAGPIIFFSIGTLLLFIFYLLPPPRESIVLPSILIKLGAISYGIYVVHFPISLILSHILVFSGSFFTFIVRIFLDITLVLIAGYLLEKRFQPWIKNYL